MSEHPIQGMMSSSMEKIRDMVDVNTIVGDPINSPDGTVIIPISKVGYGFACGGTDFPTKVPSTKDLFGGASGAGITITPVAFLTISNGEVKLLQINQYDSAADRAIGMVPDFVEKVNGLFKKSGDKKSEHKAKDEKEAKEKKEMPAVQDEKGPVE